MAPPAKRAKLLSDVDESNSESDGGINVHDGTTAGFKINQEFAQRFEHNKKREEQHRLEEKFANNKSRGGEQDEDSDESTDESEDDQADLATKDLDEEIAATLQAIRNKDPKVYDTNVKFYRDWEQGDGATEKEKREKPMYLQDYHRQQLMAGNAGDDEDAAEDPPRTYQEEQDALRRDVVGQMHANGNADEAEDSDDDFMVMKKDPKHSSMPNTDTDVHPSRAKRIEAPKVEDADKDPETFLSNFMAARAWLPSDGSHWQPFDSDDSEEERRADEFEEAYNMRFENPATANEKLHSFARDVAQYSVRREDKTGRKRARDREREQREAQRDERRRERERLKKLKMDEVEEKVARIRDAAGLKKGEELDLDEWRHVLNNDFDDAAWEEEMKRRFGEKYYQEEDLGFGDESDSEAYKVAKKKQRKVKKPKWEDEIDIKDLVPEFEDDDVANPPFTLSTDDEDGDGQIPADSKDTAADGSHATTKKSKMSKNHAKDKLDAKRTARRERAKIEELVDSTLPLAHPSLATEQVSKKAPVTGFRYRETSPTSFGLSARDILFAEDSQLNQFAGLKKFASFRDEEKKARDRKKFSKKARLRQWRKEVFGKPDEPDGGFEKVLGSSAGTRGSGASEGKVAKKGKRGNRGKKGVAVD